MVNFSRPTPLNIYLELDLTVNSDFPQNGATDVENAILGFGQALGIGTDVIVYPKLVAALCQVPGIEDVIVRIGLTNTPTRDDNITVESNQILSLIHI